MGGDQQYMDHKAEIEERMTRYLLGRLSETERAQVEQEFFADNEYFERLLAVEDALIDRYLLGELSSADREAAEELLLSSPRQWQEVELAQDLMHSVSKTAGRERASQQQGDLKRRVRWSLPSLTQLRLRAMSPSTIVLLLLLALNLSLLAWNLYLLPRMRQAENDLAEAKRANQEIQRQLAEEENRSENMAREIEEKNTRYQQAEQLIAQLQNDSSSGALAQIELSPDVMTRNSGRLKVLRIEAGADKIQIHLVLKEQVVYKQYNVSIKNFEGNEILPIHNLAANQIRRGRLSFLVPANIFSKNDYTITLNGISEGRGPVEIHDYSFRVIR